MEEEANGQGRSSREATKREDLDKDLQAAWTLVRMSEKILDVDAAKQLCIQREKIERDRQTIVSPICNDLDRDDLIVMEKTGRQLPRFPPVLDLTGIIERCSQPFAKELTASDLNKKLCKLTLTREKVIDLLMPMLEPSDGDVASGIQVITYDWKGKGYPMTFKAWNENKLYVLTTGWNTLRDDHQCIMNVKDLVIVWMFRHNYTKRLCFALYHVKA